MSKIERTKLTIKSKNDTAWRVRRRTERSGSSRLASAVRSLFAIGLIALTSVFSACFDLGNYGEIADGVSESNYSEYYKTYYEAFGTVDLFTQEKTWNQYELEQSFFSKSTVDDFTWEDDDYAVAYDEYVYMALKVEKNLTVDEVSLYLKKNQEEEGTDTTSSTLHVYLYVMDGDTFDKLNEEPYDGVPTYDTDLYEEDEEEGEEGEENEKDDESETDQEGEDTETQEKKRITFDFPDAETACGEAIVSLSSKKFNSFTIKSFHDSQDDTIEITEGSYIILSFYNNTAYGKELGYQKVNFTALDLLVRADVN